MLIVISNPSFEKICVVGWKNIKLLWFIRKADFNSKILKFVGIQKIS